MRAPIDIVIVPENKHWGGSELLWSKSAIALVEKGITVKIVAYNKLVLPKEVLQELTVHQIEILRPYHSKVSRWSNFIHRFLPYRLRFHKDDRRLALIESLKPKLVVVNQGFNFNGVLLMTQLWDKNIPYVSVSHGVSEMYWPPKELRKTMLAGFKQAKHNFFVSQDNIEVTQLQLGQRLTNLGLVRNPFQVPYTTPPTFPELEGFHLACVGRYDFKTKGQDVLLRVMMQEKWQTRPLTIHFFGDGDDEDNLKSIVDNYKLPNIKIHPYTPTVDIWNHMHGLILPSRSEGLPISLVEAMLSYRVAIVTNVSGSLEVMLPNETGFVASAPRPVYLDEALENAWQRRMEWEDMGKKAGAHIRTLVPEFPEQNFADTLITLLP